MSTEKVIEEVIFELGEYREDERSSQIQILQTIATAGTILTGIFGASFFDFTKGTFSVIFLGEHSVRFYLLILSDLIFLIAACNIISLGINNVIRFHYIRNLEDKLACLISQVSGEESLVNWMSFAAVINTKNIKHIFNSRV